MAGELKRRPEDRELAYVLSQSHGPKLELRRMLRKESDVEYVKRRRSISSRPLWPTIALTHRCYEAAPPLHLNVMGAPV